MKLYLLLFFVCLAALISVGTVNAQDTARAKVTEILSGDSFLTDQNGIVVKLIGIYIPDVSDGTNVSQLSQSTGVEIDTIKKFGLFIIDVVSRMVLGKDVILISDKYSPDKDPKGKLLRYVLFDGDKILNEFLINYGYAFASGKYEFERSDYYKKLMLVSMKNNNGLFSWEDFRKLQPIE